MMFDGLGAVNTFLAYDIFNLREAYQDGTPSYVEEDLYLKTIAWQM